MKLDHYNLAILRVLSKNARIPTKQLAGEIGLSVSACWSRLRSLEESGLIQSSHAIIDLKRLREYSHVTTLVKLESHHIEDFDRFESAVQQIPQIIRCKAVIGEVDYILEFVTTDINDYQTQIEKLLSKRLGIKTYYSQVQSKQIKDDFVPALDKLLQDLDCRKRV